MPSKYQILEETRVKISESVQEAQILFKIINNSNEPIDISVLSGLGYKVCCQIRKKCEEHEFYLDSIKNFLD